MHLNSWILLYLLFCLRTLAQLSGVFVWSMCLFLGCICALYAHRYSFMPVYTCTSLHIHTRLCQLYLHRSASSHMNTHTHTVSIQCLVVWTSCTQQQITDPCIPVCVDRRSMYSCVLTAAVLRLFVWWGSGAGCLGAYLCVSFE